MPYNPFRPLALDQANRMKPYEKNAPKHAGFEGVREIVSNEDEDFKDLMTYNPEALYDPDKTLASQKLMATIPEQPKSADGETVVLDRAVLEEAATAIESSPVGKEDALFNPMDYLKPEQRGVVLAYLYELAKMEQYSLPGAVGLLKKIQNGQFLSQDEQAQFVIYMRSWKIFLTDDMKKGA